MIPLCVVCHKRMTDWYIVCPKNIDCQNKWEHRQWMKRNSKDYIYGVTYEVGGEEE